MEYSLISQGPLDDEKEVDLGLEEDGADEDWSLDEEEESFEEEEEELNEEES